jgi:hypothetical protein
VPKAVVISIFLKKIDNFHRPDHSRRNLLDGNFRRLTVADRSIIPVNSVGLCTLAEGERAMYDESLINFILILCLCNAMIYSYVIHVVGIPCLLV